jgi:hypothetical protein
MSDFWDRTWRERRDAIEAALGPIEDDVVSFSWPRPRLPGACAASLPPIDAGPRRRSEWLSLSIGLSQPRDAAEVREQRARGVTQSGLGYELGVLTEARVSWSAELLYELVTYFTEPDARLVRPTALIATGITKGEWALARSSTSQHLLLLLITMGIGQKTDPERACLTRDASAMTTWGELAKLDAAEAWERVFTHAG